MAKKKTKKMKKPMSLKEVVEATSKTVLSLSQLLQKISEQMDEKKK